MTLNSKPVLKVLLSTTASFLVVGMAAAAIVNLLPSSDGYLTQWTPSSGTIHYSLVDESGCNGTADYNYNNTVGAIDSYGINLSSVPNGATITSLQITPCASQNKKGGNRNSIMNVFYRYNGVNSAAAGNYALGGTTPVLLGATNFLGLSLPKDALTSLQVGAVLSSGSMGARLSKIMVAVNYTFTTSTP